MRRLEFRDFLEVSLEVLEREVPSAYAGLEGALRDLPLRLEIDGRAMVLAFENGRHALRGAHDAPVCLRTSRDAILDLVEGRLGLVEALREERLWLQGEVAALVRVDEALRVYLAGAVRARGFVPLLDDYRRRGGRTRAA